MKTGRQNAIQFIHEKSVNPLVNFFKASAPNPCRSFFYVMPEKSKCSLINLGVMIFFNNVLMPGQKEGVVLANKIVIHSYVKI